MARAPNRLPAETSPSSFFKIELAFGNTLHIELCRFNLVAACYNAVTARRDAPLNALGDVRRATPE